MRAILFRGLQKELFCPAYWRVGSLGISYDEGTFISKRNVVTFCNGMFCINGDIAKNKKG